MPEVGQIGSEEPKADYDGAWKEALEIYLKPFLLLCFPYVVDEIDWTCKPRFHDKELQKLARGANLGKQHVDKLVKVRLTDGQEKWVIIHVEVQSQRDDQLPLRLYRYHHRLVDYYGIPVATLVILGDDEPSWRPGPYREKVWKGLVYFRYSVCKLIDLEYRAARPLFGNSPAAILVSAHLAAKRTRGNMELRLKWKWIFIRRLYRFGYDGNTVRELFRLIDWMMALPLDKDLELRRRITDYESKKMTPYITSIQRIGRAEGREEGREEGRTTTLREIIIDTLENKFGDLPQELTGALARIREANRLKDLARRAISCDQLKEFTGHINLESSN